MFFFIVPTHALHYIFKIPNSHTKTLKIRRYVFRILSVLVWDFSILKMQWSELVGAIKKRLKQHATRYNTEDAVVYNTRLLHYICMFCLVG
jgi:hypothetical protein